MSYIPNKILSGFWEYILTSNRMIGPAECIVTILCLDLTRINDFGGQCLHILSYVKYTKFTSYSDPFVIRILNVIPNLNFKIEKFQNTI